MATDEFWAILDDAAEVTEVAVEEAAERRTPGNPYQPHCLCGRFAKWVGDRHYYNGQFDCYRYTVRCSRCGVVDVECV